MILGARPMQLALIRRAKQMGIRVVAVDNDPAAPGLSLADESHVTDLANVKTCLDIAQSHKVDGVLTFAADYPVRTMATLTTTLGLPGLGPATAARATDKKLLRQTLTANGLASPRWGPIDSPEVAIRDCRLMQADSIIKPAMSSGGRGVTQIPRFCDPDTIASAFEHATHFGDGSVMIEEFVLGPEFSVELAVHENEAVVIAVTDKRSVGPPHWVEIGHSQPSEQPGDVQGELVATAQRAAAAMEMSECIAHIELRLAEAGPVVIEAAARAAGGYIASHLVPLSTGIDLPAAAINLAIGEEPVLDGQWSRGAAVRFFEVKPGTITSVDGLSEARNSPGVEHLDLDIGVGDEVQPLQDATHRIGQVICTGVSGTEAMSRCEDATRHVRIETVAR